jgi:predicted neuraminidase
MSKKIKDYTVHEQILVPVSQKCPRAGEGSAELLKDGSILFVYGAFEGPDDYANASIVKRISRDGGITWSEPEILQTKVRASDMNVMSASLLRLHNGDLAFLFLSKHTSRTDCRPMFSLSSDEGKKWSAPREITDVPGYYVVNNDRLVQTSGGRILVPCAWYPQDENLRNCLCGIIYSDNNGQNWRRGRGWIRIKPEDTIPPPLASESAKKYWNEIRQAGHVNQEPGVIELKDGSIMMWVRTGSGYMYAACSQAGGDAWSNFRPVPDIISPCGPQSIKRLPRSNRLICIYNDHSDPAFVYDKEPHHGLYWSWRTPLAAAGSDDEGKTWQRIGDIEGTERNYCYPSILFFEDRVLLTYYWSEEVIKNGIAARRNLASLKVKIIRQDYFI